MSLSAHLFPGHFIRYGRYFRRCQFNPFFAKGTQGRQGAPVGNEIDAETETVLAFRAGEPK